MRTVTHSALCFTVLLVLCLMFAPSRKFTGDRLANAAPTDDVLPNLQATSTTKDFAELLRTDPLEAIAESLRAYKQLNPEAYTCTFIKQERLAGKLHPPETINAAVREIPFSVLLRWTEGKRRADATLYVAGENDDQLLIIPSGDLEKRVVKLTGTPYAKRSTTSTDAKGAARYPINQFGLFNVTKRYYSAWKAAADQQALHVKYLGLQEVAALKGKKCHVLERQCVEPDEGDITKVIAYFDPETHLLCGSILYAGDELLAQYFYLDVRFDARLNADHFNASLFR